MLKVIRSKLHTLFLPLLFWLTGIVLSTQVGFHWSSYLGIALLFVLALMLPKLRFIVLLPILMLLGWAYSDLFLTPQTNNISYYLEQSNQIQEKFEYKIISEKRTSQNKKYYIAELRKLNSYKMKGKVLLYNNQDTLQVNHLYQTPLKIEELSQPLNPGEFNFKKHYLRLGVVGRAYTLGLTEGLGKKESWLESLRQKIIVKIETTFGANADFALALFLGEKGLLKIDQEKLSELGLLHLFAVSGLHVGIIFVTLLAILNIFLSLRNARFSASIILLLYGSLCSWSPSVFRTVLIIFIYNLTLTLQRKVSFLQLLSLTLFIITISNPLQIFSVGLHLSLSAFIALWIADRKFIVQLYKVSRKYNLNRYIFTLFQYLIYSGSVILFITPLSAYYFNIISFNAIITNVVATPIVALMLNTILFTLIIPQFLGINALLGRGFHLLLIVFEKLTDYANFLPFFTKSITFTGGEFLCLVAGLTLSYLIYKKRKVAGIALLSALLILIMLNALGFFVTYQDRIIFFAAGNADCSYIEFADKHNLIIDTGSDLQSVKIVKNALIPYLKKRHIRSVEKVIITHPHEDHYGGLDYLCANFKVNEVIIHKTALADELFSNLIDKIKDEVKLTVLTDTTSMLANRVRFLYPNSDYDSHNMNDNSFIVMVENGGSKILFTGDIEADAERRVVELYGEELQANLLKSPHHGSITSSTQEFLTAVSPQLCFIPAGNREKSKFPNPVILDRLRELDIHFVIGRVDGALILDKHGHQIYREHKKRTTNKM